MNDTPTTGTATATGTATGTAATPTPGTADTAARSPLTCPECGEVALAVAPVEWPLAGWRSVPRFSHHDGTPLCPVVGPDGYTPVEPTDPAPARTAPADTATTGPTEPVGAPVTGGDTAADDRCRTEGCPGDPNDGDGYDGFCASCADAHEAAGTWG